MEVSAGDFAQLITLNAVRSPSRSDRTFGPPKSKCFRLSQAEGAPSHRLSSERVRHCFCLVFPLPLWLRYCLSLRSSGSGAEWEMAGFDGFIPKLNEALRAERRALCAAEEELTRLERQASE